MEEKGTSLWSVAAAFAAGAAAGSVTALLLAPRSGAETRARIGVVPHAVKEAVVHAKQAGVDAFNQNYTGHDGGRSHARH